jgi:DNA-binding protein
LIGGINYSSVDIGSVSIESSGIRRRVSTIKIVLSRVGKTT